MAMRRTAWAYAIYDGREWGYQQDIGLDCPSDIAWLARQHCIRKLEAEGVQGPFTTGERVWDDTPLPEQDEDA